MPYILEKGAIMHFSPCPFYLERVYLDLGWQKMNITNGKGEYYNKNQENGDGLLTIPKLMLAHQQPHIIYLIISGGGEKTGIHMYIASEYVIQL